MQCLCDQRRTCRGAANFDVIDTRDGTNTELWAQLDISDYQLDKLKERFIFLNVIERCNGRPTMSAKPTYTMDQDDRYLVPNMQHKLSSAVEGTRNHTLNRFAHGWMVRRPETSFGELLDIFLEPALQSGLPEYEVRATLQSVFKAGAR